MAIKAQIEAIIYAAEEPVTIEQMAVVLKDAVLAEGGFDEGLEQKEIDGQIKQRVKAAVEELAEEYQGERGMEIRQVAGGWRMATKPEHHDMVRHFVKSLKPPVKLSLPALETLAVIAYKQPVTAPEISEIRGVDSSGVLSTLLDRKLITTAGRKQVIGRPIMYKTSKDFLLRFGLKDVSELPSLEEFEKLGSDGQVELFEQPGGSQESRQDGGESQACETAAVEGEGGNVESEPSLTPGQESSQSSEPAAEFPQESPEETPTEAKQD